MLTRFRFRLIGAGLIAMVSLLMSGQVLASPKIQHWSTDNGARVYFVAAPQLPMVDVRLVFDAGSSRDGKSPGLATLTNQLLDRGLKGMDEEAIAAQLEGLGARYGAGVDRDMATLSLRSLSDPDLLQPATALVARIVAEPRFPNKVLKRERQRLLLALQSEAESPSDIAERRFYQALYGEHPYAHQADGEEKSLSKLGRGDLVDFHRRYYVAANAVIAIVGDLDRHQAEQLANRLVAGLPKGEAAPALPAVAALAQSQEHAIKHPSSQSHILMGQPGMKRGDKDFMPLYVGNHILGGSGFGSRVMKEIREKRGLSYSAYSYFYPLRENGPFLMGLQTRNEKVAEAERVLKATLAQFIKQGPSAKELQAAKKNITGGFPLRVDSNKDIVQYLAMIGFYRLPMDYLERFNQRVNAVTRTQIQQAFARRVDSNKLVTVIVGNGKP